jgi:hypothetical protein
MGRGCGVVCRHVLLWRSQAAEFVGAAILSLLGTLYLIVDRGKGHKSRHVSQIRPRFESVNAAAGREASERLPQRAASRGVV